MMNFEKLFEQFVREKVYLVGVTKKTEAWYWDSWKALKRMMGTPETIDRFFLNEFVIKLREAGVKPRSINTYTCGINSFLTWLWENNFLGERLRIKPLKVEEKIIPTYTESDLKALLSFKPRTKVEHRLYAIICLLTDTGMRINEALTITREDVDLENLLIRVYGKGSKERFVPISFECRKVLYNYLKRHSFDLVFCSLQGKKLGYRNMLRDFKDLCRKVGVENEKISFHVFRHTFATEYLRSGGGELYLQRALGHTSLAMTKRYAQINEEDLKRVHLKNSLLSRLK